MKAYGITDIGRVRDSNQDSFAYSLEQNEAVWAVVCDGMGGANGGYYASSTARDVYSQAMNINLNSLKAKQIENLMTEAVVDANKKIYDTALNQPDLMGMGTTLVSAVLVNGEAFIVHVGDSRAYLIRDNEITQLTEDHSVVQELINLNKITKEEAKNHPEKNMITRAVGVRDSVESDINKISLNKSDAIVLCTDGLSNLVEDFEILNTVKENSQQAAAQQLVSLALSRGGNDNITVVVIK
ncbi:MAG: Stp1/IreP family PP2C-type Ser/Thr phosphatase [Oscillospiraceae bacterium]|nr:Stp1/IreP family PP2C-type Ser/Thr phosphatase [Oscillospiraceae bacterium]